MPRVHHVKAARKDNPVVKKGESYYWWKFRRSGKQYSKTYPKQSQLTQSEFLGQVYDIQDRLDELTVDHVREGVIEEIANDVRALGEEQEGKRQNMPDALQYSPTGELLEERAQSCEVWADQLENIEIPDDVEEPDDEPEEPEETDFDDPEEYEAACDEFANKMREYAYDQEAHDNYIAELEAAVEEAQELQYEGE